MELRPINLSIKQVSCMVHGMVRAQIIHLAAFRPNFGSYKAFQLRRDSLELHTAVKVRLRQPCLVHSKIVYFYTSIMALFEAQQLFYRHAS